MKVFWKFVEGKVIFYVFHLSFKVEYTVATFYRFFWYVTLWRHVQHTETILQHNWKQYFNKYCNLNITSQKQILALYTKFICHCHVSIDACVLKSTILKEQCFYTVNADRENGRFSRKQFTRKLFANEAEIIVVFYSRSIVKVLDRFGLF